MYLKKRYQILIIMGIVLLIWIGTMAYNSVLTRLYKDEFVNFDSIGFEFEHAWVGEPEICVLSYSSQKAKVYFFTNRGGEKTLFVKKDGEWRYEKTLAIWTSAEQGGNADDYFIWPYYKNYVP